MHDPMTVAFEIRLPFGGHTSVLGNGTKHTMRPAFITIWHKDPEKRRGRVCRRADDTCGWSRPNPSREEHEAIEKLAAQQYKEICSRQVAEAERQTYAYVCNDPSTVDAVYWSWRALKHHFNRKVLWQYGTELTFKEWQAVFTLATNPVDSVRFTFTQIHDVETFTEFFMIVYNNYLRFYRPWYKHPKWHVHHWRIQFHPWQKFYRRFFQKCAVCGKRGFPKGVHAMGDWSGTRTWHSTCDNMHGGNAPLVKGAGPIKLEGRQWTEEERNSIESKDAH